jgi:hypothetical protein
MTWLTPAALSAAPTSARSCTDRLSIRAYSSPVARRKVVRPAAVATGLPDRVPAW